MSIRTGELISKIFQRSSKWRNLDEEEKNTLKRILINITGDIVEVCEKKDITYFLSFGSALGSVRHKGFIPWDDDIDLCMPRKDYSNFLSIFEKEMGDKYYVRCVSKGDSLGVATAHIILKGTKYINYGDLVSAREEPDETHGIYVDIFPLDDAPNNIIIRKIHGIRCLFILFISGCVGIKEQIVYLEKDGVKLSKEEKKQLRMKKILGTVFSYRSVVEWTKRFDKLSRKYQNDSSRYVTCYQGYKSLTKSVYLRSDLFPCSKGLFEGHEWNLPNKPDNFLTQVYHDYMIIPQEEKQRIHPVIELSFDK